MEPIDQIKKKIRELGKICADNGLTMFAGVADRNTGHVIRLFNGSLNNICQLNSAMIIDLGEDTNTEPVSIAKFVKANTKLGYKLGKRQK